ncbi:unnamed protein product, partial [Ectocarpus sp. 12 AP-2014]
MRSTDSLLGVPATHHEGRAEAIFKEEEQQQQQQQQQRQPRSTSRSKKIALLGGLRGLITRSRSSGNKDAAAAGSATILGTKSPADLFAAEDAEHLAANTAVNGINHDDDTATYNNIFGNSPPRNVFSAASWPKATAAAGSPASGSNQCGGRPSHRMRREENFHAAMDNRLVYTAFSSFCNKTLSSENVEFVLQVRDVNQLLEMEETTAGDLREKLRQVAAAFVNPNSATEVNVKGSTRASALGAIGAALEAAGHDGCCCCGGGGRGNAGEEGCCPTSCAWALAEEAIEALARLAEEVHSVIFDGLWPRFLVSEEFRAMMNTEEMRMVGFTDLDGNVIVGPLASQQQQQQPSWEGGRRMRGSLSSTAGKRHLSSRLVSSIKGLGSSGGGSGMTGWGGGEGAEMASASTASRGGGVRGGSESSPPPSTKTPFAATSRMLSSSSSRSGGPSTGSCGDVVRATKTVENATTHAPPTTTTDRFPLGGRRNFGLPALRSS